MGAISGILSKAGFRVESDQGMVSGAYPATVVQADTEEVTLQEYDLIPFTSEGIEEEHSFESAETLTGSPAYLDSDRVSLKGGGSLSCSMQYDGLTQLIACATGYSKPGGSGSPGFLTSTALTAGTCTSTTWVDSGTPFASSDVGRHIRITSGSGEGQVRRISAYSSSSSVTVTPAWSVTPSATNSAVMSGEFRHTFELAKTLHDQPWTDLYSSYPTGGVGTANDKIIRRGTYAVIKRSSTAPWVWRSCFVNSMGISASAGGGLTAEFDLMAFDVDRSSSTNTSGSESNWKFHPVETGLEERAMFSDIEFFRIGAYDATTALTSSDEIGISEFSVTLNNALQGDTQDTVSGLYRAEPTRGGTREVSGSISIPRYDADTLIDYLNNDTKLMAHLRVSGSTMDSNSKQLDIYINSLKLTNGSNPVSGAGALTQSFDFQAFVPNSNAGYPGATASGQDSGDQELTIELINRFPFNPLQDQNGEY